MNIFSRKKNDKEEVENLLFAKFIRENFNLKHNEDLLQASSFLHQNNRKEVISALILHALKTSK
jgi:hypothetical protein